MKLRTSNLLSGLILAALLLCCSPINSFAQDGELKMSQKAIDQNNLPVASNNSEYKIYCDIATLPCQKTLIEQGQEFIAKNPNSQLRYPLYQNLVTAAIRLNNFDQAFDFGRKALAVFPDHMLVMTQLSSIASNQLLMGNNKYAQEAEGYAYQAINLINNGKMPYGYMTDAWQPYKTNLLGDLYQSLGVFALMNGCSEDSANYLMQATELHPYEPYTYFLLAKAQVQLYGLGVRDAVVVNKTSNKKSTLAEQITETYARASVLTENERYKSLRTAIDYDMDMLGKALPTLKSNFAKSIESVRSEMNALASPTAASAQ
jgi:tetratricopeptide (TPR) repeat protein